MTATGVDCRTDVDALEDTPDVEFGFLYSVNQAGRAKRYPTWEFIKREASVAKYNPLALHLCGTGAYMQFVTGKLDVSAFGRIQINGHHPADQIESVCRLFPGKRFIVQYRGKQSDELLKLQEPNLSILVDGSGGKGIIPKSWPLLDTQLAVGFAGGLSPTNMFDQVNLIRAVARTGWWVDLETNLRTADDYFSLHKVKRARAAFMRALKQPIPSNE